MAGKLPYFPFYPADWIRDTRFLTLETRAIWIDILSLMHDSDRRGYLTSRTGTPYSAEQIAAFCGCSPDTAARAVQELLTSGVASCTDTGTLFSRRMVADEKKRRLCSDAGKKGGGNPKLTYKGHLNTKSKGDLKRKKADFSDSNSDSEIENAIPGKGGEGEGMPTALNVPGFLAAWADWLDYRRERRFAVYKPKSLAALFAHLATFGPEIAAEAIRVSIRSNWQGLFPEKVSPVKGTNGRPGETTAQRQARARRELEERRAREAEGALTPEQMREALEEAKKRGPRSSLPG